MLFTEEWLRQYCNPDLSTDELTEALTMAGLEVEEATKIAPDFTGVVVAEVVTCRDHENSDHLHVCEVNIGSGELVQIVCGAPNVRAGVRVPCATIGAVLPGGFTIKKTKLRGELSMGMLCSARELGVSEDHGGLWILPEDAPIGMNIREYAHLDDSRIEIKLTPNRGDALSLVGVARDLRAVTGARLTLPTMTKLRPTCDCIYPVQVQDRDLCGRFTHRVIRGVNAKAPTPQWMKDRLERSGLRSINALVDISNYVMMELGLPTHFYDMDRFEGDHLTVRWAREGEKASLLNEQRVVLTPYYGVICDGDTPESLAGIMGGEKTSVSLDTTSILVEAAFWHQSAIQGRCRRLTFSSDAAHRYERGVDFGNNPAVLDYITSLVLQICGTSETKFGPIVDQVFDLPERKAVCMRVARCNKIIGIEIAQEKMAEIFTRLGFEYTYADGVFEVKAPTYRFDIEIEEDLIEEVARLYGYENLPDRAPVAPIQMKSRLEQLRGNHDLRKEMAVLGYQELINFSFVPEAWEKDFANNEEPIRLRNPIASHLSVMRTQLIGGLVDILKYNLNRRQSRVRVFELGRVFVPDATVIDGPWSVKGIRQPLHLAGLAYGTAADRQWGIETRRVDFYDVKGDIERLIAPLKARYVADALPGLHPGRCASIYIGRHRVGYLGELHPRVAHTYDLPNAPVVFELDVASLLHTRVPSYTPLSKFQPMFRDIAVMVPASMRVQQLIDAVHRAKLSDPRLQYVTGFALFDMYRPKTDSGLADEKSLAFKVELVTYKDEALTDKDVEMSMTALMDILSRQGARLRD